MSDLELLITDALRARTQAAREAPGSLTRLRTELDRPAPRPWAAVVVAAVLLLLLGLVGLVGLADLGHRRAVPAAGEQDRLPPDRYAVAAVAGAPVVVRLDSGEVARRLPGGGDSTWYDGRLSADGRRVWGVWDRVAGQNGFSYLGYLDLSTGRTHAVARHPDGGMSRPVPSADGRWLVYWLLREPQGPGGPSVSSLVRRDLRTGREQQLPAAPVHEPGPLALSPDGRTVVLARTDQLAQDVLVVDVEAGFPRARVVAGERCGSRTQVDDLDWGPHAIYALQTCLGAGPPSYQRVMRLDPAKARVMPPGHRVDSSPPSSSASTLTVLHDGSLVVGFPDHLERWSRPSLRAEPVPCGCGGAP